MTTSNSMYKDFVKAQKEFKPVVFNKVNPFHKSKYADLGSHLDSVIGPLNNNNFSLIQKTHECENGVCVETILLHESGEHISGGVLRIPVVKNDPQGNGAALTYARRFSLGALLSLYGEEDNDGNEHLPERNDSRKPINKPIIQQKIDNMKQAQAKLKSKEDLILEAEKAASLGIKSLETWWKGNISKEERDSIAYVLPSLKEKAEQFDEINQDVGE